MAYWKLQDDSDILLVGRLVKQVDRQPLNRHLHGTGNDPFAESIECGFLLVDFENQTFMFGFAVPVDINNASRGVKDILDALRQLETLLIAAAIDLSDQRCQHRRAGRDFRDGDSGPIFFCDFSDPRPHAYGDFMALQ